MREDKEDGEIQKEGTKRHETVVRIHEIIENEKKKNEIQDGIYERKDETGEKKGEED